MNSTSQPTINPTTSIPPSSPYNISIQPQVAIKKPNPKAVGKSFVLQYYTALSKNSDDINILFGEESVFSYWNGEESTTDQGSENITKRLKLLNLEGCKTNIQSFDCQNSINGSVLICLQGVIMYNTKEKPPKRFTQTFLLAREQENGNFYVYNNIFRITPDSTSNEGNQQTKENEEELLVEDTKTVTKSFTSPITTVIANHRSEIDSPRNNVSPPITITPTAIPPIIQVPPSATPPILSVPIEKIDIVSVPITPPIPEKEVPSTRSAELVKEEKIQEQKVDVVQAIEPQPTVIISPVSTELKPPAPVPKAKPTYAEMALLPPDTTPANNLTSTQNIIKKAPPQVKTPTAPKVIEYEESQTTVIVKNIPYLSTKPELDEFFKPYGTIKQIDLSKGQGWIHYTSSEAVVKLLDAHSKNPFIIQNRTLTIERKRIDKNKEKNKSGKREGNNKNQPRK